MGDFNATGPEDRAAIFDMSERTEMVWLSESLECTSYWERPDQCEGSALDHVLVEAIPFSVAARGPCETEGCDTRESCPIFHREVSDHCPVVAEIF
jgi:endonuclease/exonuclease/phosphatase family metal-dependent hydrolase